MIGPEAALRHQPAAPRAAPQSARIGKGPVIGSAFVHTVAIFLAWWVSAAPTPVPDFIVFEIELISPPAAELGEPTMAPPQELVIERPTDPVPEPQEETPRRPSRRRLPSTNLRSPKRRSLHPTLSWWMNRSLRPARIRIRMWRRRERT